MRTLFASIASLMLMLTLWSGMPASAAVAAGQGGVASSVEGMPPGHVAGDADEVPADSDRATPHHHNISHNHDIGVPARAWTALAHAAASLPRDHALLTPSPLFAPYRDLRPPIA